MSVNDLVYPKHIYQHKTRRQTENGGGGGVFTN